MSIWGTAVGSFLLAFSALISIVNPVGGALIYNQVTAGRKHSERAALARKIAVYSAIVMLTALWAGASVISFFGISLAALRIAGGLVVAVRAWEMLTAPQENEDRKLEQAAPATTCDDVAFFPLTIPFTTGPGTISVAIALSSSRPNNLTDLAPFSIGISAAAIAVALCVAVAYSFANRVVDVLGPVRSRILARLAAFLLLCIGTQILLNGIIDVVNGVMQHQPNSYAYPSAQAWHSKHQE
jgi:multiple antibiotic resistance protein